MDCSDKVSFLDQYRLNYGPFKLKAFYHNLLIAEPDRALRLINDKDLCYCSLFLLYNEIEALHLNQFMSFKNAAAISITKDILNKPDLMIDFNFKPTDYIQIVYSTLKWMLGTGYYNDGLNDDFDKVLDICSALLIKVYNDKSFLPIIAEMIFERNNKGYYIHDLVWIFFQAKDPRSLIIIAKYLMSPRESDKELAKILLNFAQIPEKSCMRDNETQYSLFLEWLKDNNLYLCFTGEHFHRTPDPKPYTIILEAKYLCNPISIDTGEMLKPLTEKETTLLTNFKSLDEDIKLSLADYSLKLYQKDKSNWDKWINLTLNEQIQKSADGGI